MKLLTAAGFMVACLLIAGSASAQGYYRGGYGNGYYRTGYGNGYYRPAPRAYPVPAYGGGYAPRAYPAPTYYRPAYVRPVFRAPVQVWRGGWGHGRRW
jgi:hypothetical protein